MTIPVNEPALGAREVENVVECLRSGWISSAGAFLERFESGWASYCGRRHGIAVCNGTAALELAVAALRLGPGDEVILPTFTIISCAAAVVARGATPVLVVKEGRCLLDLYDDERQLVVTWELGAGDLVLLVAGGHGVRMLEDTILIEVKQGPYTGLQEKERF